MLHWRGFAPRLASSHESQPRKPCVLAIEPPPLPVLRQERVQLLHSNMSLSSIRVKEREMECTASISCLQPVPLLKRILQYISTGLPAMVTSATAPDHGVMQGLCKASQTVSSRVKESLQKASLPSDAP